MAGTMFRDVVCPRASETQKRYTVPLSILIHGALSATVIIAPLIATAELPSPPKMLLPYVVAQAVPSPPPVAPRPHTIDPAAATATSAIPIGAPNGVGVETGLIPDTGPIETASIDGFVNGLGGHGLWADDVAPPASSVPVQPVRPGGSITSPTRIKYVPPPDYPQLAKQNRIEGVVIIEAVIGTDGRVQDARVIRSAQLLDEAALQAVRGWEYTPTLLNGRPTPVIMTVTVRFTLK